MESCDSKSANQLDVDQVPPWAIPLFEKVEINTHFLVTNFFFKYGHQLSSQMKADICAETHAKIAYSVRLMLDDMVDEIKSSINPNKVCPSQGEDCCCQNLQHVMKCLKKCRAICYAQKKEEKKQAKLDHKLSRRERKKEGSSKYAAKYAKSSSTEGETEFESQTLAAPRSSKTCRHFDLMHHSQGVELKSIAQIISPPPTPRKASLAGSSLDSIQRFQNITVKENSTPLISLDDSPTDSKVNPLESCREPPKSVPREVFWPQMCQNPLSKSSTSKATVAAAAAVDNNLPSLSDSEFEVVSLPQNINQLLEDPKSNNYLLISLMN